MYTKSNNTLEEKQHFSAKDYSILNKEMLDWHDRLSDGYDLCVMLSRKGPRVNENIEEHLPASKHLNVVTENAIPFIDMKKVRRCAVADEAIYHGTTFAKVYDIVKNSVSQGTVIDAVPIFVTTEASLRLHSLLSPTQHLIDNNCINFFVDTVISKFHQLGKPYDMEFPLLYADMGESFSTEKMISMVKEIEDHYNATLPTRLKLSSYAIDHISRIEESEGNNPTSSTTKNVTLLLEGLFATVFTQGSKPDFAKLRFMCKDNRLCIAVMTPYVINSLDLKHDSTLFSGDVLEIWNLLYEAAESYQCHTNECEYQKEKSLVVMANYLLSYCSFMKVAPVVEPILKKHGAKKLELDEKDLTYLVGKQLAKKIEEKLETSFIQYEIPQPTLLPVTISDRRIPKEYEEAYQKTLWNLSLEWSSNVEYRLSNIFSTMHNSVEIKSRRHDSSFGRLRFGESYSSICRPISIGDVEPRVWTEVNRGMDRRIDRGSVVPNYVHEQTPTYSYWHRLFRSGENEDLLRDQTSRIIGYITYRFIRQAGMRSVPRPYVELVICILFNRARLSDRVFAYNVDFEARSGSIQSVFNTGNGTGQTLSLIDIAIQNGVASNILLDHLALNGSVYNESGGSPLSDDLESKIIEIVNGLLDILKSLELEDSSSELINFLLYDYIGTFNKVHDFAEYVNGLLKSQEEITDYEAITRSFIDLFKIYPDFGLKDLQQAFIDINWKTEAACVEAVQQETSKNQGFRLLVTTYYLINTWHRLSTGTDMAKINENNTSFYLHEFEEEERINLEAIKQMEISQAREALCSMLGNIISRAALPSEVH